MSSMLFAPRHALFVRNAAPHAGPRVLVTLERKPDSCNLSMAHMEGLVPVSVGFLGEVSVPAV